jgi:hypothetical protein
LVKDIKWKNIKARNCLMTSSSAEQRTFQHSVWKHFNDSPLCLTIHVMRGIFSDRNSLELVAMTSTLRKCDVSTGELPIPETSMTRERAILGYEVIV